VSRASIRRATRSSDLGQLMREASGRHNLWDVFADFCEMGALAIANAVDLRQREEREKRYLAKIARYDKAEQALFPQMLAALVDRMEEGPDDVLGRLFGELDLGNSARGQFFTPYELCRLMARVQVGDPATLRATVEREGFITVNEPACGAGAMIIAFSEAMREAGVEPQQHMHATCQDIDSRGVHMCFLQLALLHIPAVVVLGNTLAVECREAWYTPAQIMGGWTWRLQRGRHPLIETERPEAVTPEPEAETPAPPIVTAGPLGEQMGLF